MTQGANGDPRAAPVWAVIRGMFAAFAQRREDGVEGALADECTVWDVFEPQLIRGAAERQAFHERDRAQSMARGALSWRLEPLQLDFAGAARDVAIARYLLHFEYQPPNATAGHVRITDVLVERDRRWRIVHHHEGLRPVGPPPIGPQGSAPRVG